MVSRSFSVLFLLSVIAGIPLVGSAQVADDPDGAISTYAGVGIGGFLPMRESFRINYGTDLAGLPIELFTFVQFPASERTFAHVGLRFLRRTANFIESTEVRMLQLEPGIRYYLQPPVIGQAEDGETTTEFGLYAGIGGQISRTTVYGLIQETPDGDDPRSQEVTKDHYNLGVGAGLGLTYPFTPTRLLDAGIHVSTYLNDPVKKGGLGNLGGVSFNVAYRFGF